MLPSLQVLENPDYLFFIEVNPVAWKTPTLGTKRMGARIIPYAAPNAEVAVYQQALREQMKNEWDSPPLECEVATEWHFARQLASYRSATGRLVRKHRQDLTNLTKSSEDALQPRGATDPWGLIKNDVQVLESHQYIDVQSADVAMPYVVLAIQKLS